MEEASLFMKGTDTHWNNGKFLSLMSHDIATEINILNSNVILKYCQMCQIYYYLLNLVTLFFQSFSPNTHKTAVQLKQA